jgi:hypothetical protein
MSNYNRYQFSLASLLIAFGMLALPLGLSNWHGDHSFFICTWLALFLWVTTRRKIFAFALIVYVIAFPIGAIITIQNANPTNPYVRGFNEPLEQLAIDAKLVGSSEGRVEAVLGPATSSYSGWNAIVTSTGKPAPNALYGTTYNYAPFPALPCSQFQVHCRDGKVMSIELYDD